MPVESWLVPSISGASQQNNVAALGHVLKCKKLSKNTNNTIIHSQAYVESPEAPRAQFDSNRRYLTSFFFLQPKSCKSVADKLKALAGSPSAAAARTSRVQNKVFFQINLGILGLPTNLDDAR